MKDIYTENGYENRYDYLNKLADRFGLEYDTVKTIADGFGAEEDFQATVWFFEYMYKNHKEYFTII